MRYELSYDAIGPFILDTKEKRIVEWKEVIELLNKTEVSDK